MSNDVVIYQSDDGLVKMEAIVNASNGPEYLFCGSNCINYYRDMHENVISSYYKNIPDIKTCHDRIGERIWKREITVVEVSGAKESRSQGNGMKKG